jgi:hypothetical protein
MPEFKPIPNPYIVGNPIKSREMFFGRQDDFEYIKRKLESGVKSYIIVFSGERRSGKTSILFQVLNGELGEDFLPIMIDMQTMAGLQSENEFFEKLAKETFRALENISLNIDQYNFFQEEVSPYKVFSKLLDDIHAQFPEKNILFLIDEYELIESKISEGSLNKNFVPFLAGILESERRISFLFTGSKKLDERKSPYWNLLFAKSLYRNVSFLSKNDTIRLVTDPVKEYITYDKNVIESIYRLTAGQPFYTQVCCQNIVDHLNEKQKNSVTPEDLDKITDEILENPLPQMIYFWNSLSSEKKMILSFLAEVLENSASYVHAQDIHKFSRKKEFGINLTLKTIGTTLETLYHQQLLKKVDDKYSFYMDLLRRWIKQDHSFWQVIKEISSDLSGINVEDSIEITKTSYEDKSIFEEKSKSKILLPIIGGAIIVIAIFGYWFFLKPSSDSQDSSGRNPEAILSENMTENGAKTEATHQEQTTPDKIIAKNDEIENKNDNTKSVSRADALNAQKSMLRNKNAAIESDAEKTSPFQRALSRERQAENSLKNGQFDSASRLFSQAAKSYSDAKSSAIGNLRREVNNLLQDVKAAREKAQAGNASKLASSTFLQAESKENQGRSLFDQAQYSESKDALMEARRLYSTAASEATRSSNKLTNEIQTIKSSIQQLKNQSTTDLQYLSEFQQARGAENSGESYFADGNETQALANFQRAERLYKQAQTVHNQYVNQINQVVKTYESALKTKNIQQLKDICIENNFTNQMIKEWTAAFKSFEKIEAQMAIEKTIFQPDKILAIVNVNLKYIGFTYNESKPTWEINFTPKNNQLFIESTKAVK